MTEILLVEDDAMLQEILAERLRMRNYQVLLANNGQEAVKMAPQEMPDIILMDLRMPVLDGWEATKQLKADAITAHIPIIALTAHALVGDRQEGLAAGCDDYETKPVDFPRLLIKIENLVEKNN